MNTIHDSDGTEYECADLAAFADHFAKAPSQLAASAAIRCACLSKPRHFRAKSRRAKILNFVTGLSEKPWFSQHVRYLDVQGGAPALLGKFAPVMR